MRISICRDLMRTQFSRCTKSGLCWRKLKQVSFCDWILKQLRCYLIFRLSNKPRLKTMKSERCTKIVARLSLARTEISRLELTLLWLQLYAYGGTFNTTFSFLGFKETLMLYLFLEIIHGCQSQKLLICSKYDSEVFGCRYQFIAGFWRYKDFWSRPKNRILDYIISTNLATKRLCCKELKFLDFFGAQIREVWQNLWCESYLSSVNSGNKNSFWS